MDAKPEKGKQDRPLLFATFTLLAVGLVMVLSASFVIAAENWGDPYYYLRRQAQWVALGILGMLILSSFHYRNLRLLSIPILVLNFILLGLIFTQFGSDLGTEARRWLVLGPVVLQPSEFCKLALVIFTAAYMSNRRLNIHNFWTGSLIPLGFMFASFFMIQFQPDMGTALVALAGGALVIIFAGMPVSQAMGLGLVFLPPLAYITVREDYRLQRLFSFIDPWADPTGSGYQVIQSLYALGPGHLFGAGLGAGRQKLFYLPEPQNDFIFAVIGEELGFVGAVAVLLLYLALVWRGFQVACRAPDMFGTLLASGITFTIAVQVLVNVAVVTGSAPVTGINLPLVSAGGSSVFFTLLAIGILLNISRYGQTINLNKGAA